MTENKPEKKGWMKFVPGGLYLTIKLFGAGYVFNMIIKSLF